LSGKHGLVDPGDTIPPYDHYLGDLPEQERREWAERVHDALVLRLSNADRLTILAEPVYGEFLVELLQRDGFEVNAPLSRLSPESFASFIEQSARTADLSDQ
jgi:hypothetical protein